MMLQLLGNHFCGTKQYGFPIEIEHFHCCMLVKALSNTTMIAEGRKEGTMKDLKVLELDFG